MKDISNGSVTVIVVDDESPWSSVTTDLESFRDLIDLTLVQPIARRELPSDQNRLSACPKRNPSPGAVEVWLELIPNVEPESEGTNSRM